MNNKKLLLLDLFSLNWAQERQNEEKPLQCSSHPWIVKFDIRENNQKIYKKRNQDEIYSAAKPHWVKIQSQENIHPI